MSVGANPYLKIWISSDNLSDENSELESIRNSKQIILGPHALFYIARLKLFDVVEKLFDKILISGKILQSIQEHILLERMSSEKDFFILSYDDGKIVKEEITVESTKSRIKFFTELESWVTNSENVEIIGKSTGRMTKEKDKDLDMLRESLGDEMYETIIETQYRRLPACCFDMRSRQFIVHIFSGESFGILPLVRQLREKNLINDERFYKILLELIYVGCHFVPINAELLKQSLINHNFHTNPISLMPFECLAHPDNIVESLPSVVSEFLIWLWNDPLTPFKDNWTNEVLAVVIKGREGKQAKLVNKIQSRVTNGLNKNMRGNFINYINNWKLANKILSII